jgi:hypothetical protein
MISDDPKAAGVRFPVLLGLQVDLRIRLSPNPLDKS